MLHHLHAIEGRRLVVTPYLDDRAHGIFATRFPARPNPSGISQDVRLGWFASVLDLLPRTTADDRFG